MVRSFPCPHCETSLTPAGEAEFLVACPTCKAQVSPPWIPALALDAAPGTLPVAAPVEEAAPAAAPAAAEAPVDPVPVLEEASPAPAEPPKGVDWQAFAPVESPAPPRLAPGWRSVPLALNLVNIGSGLLLVTLLFVLVLGAVASLQGLQQQTPGGPLQISMGTHHRTTIRAEVLLGGLGLALLLGGLVLVVGKVICCAVPVESNGRLVARLSAVCLLLGLLTLLAAAAVNLGLAASWPFVLELRDQYPEEVSAFAAYGLLGGLAFHAVEVILFLLFLRHVGLFLADKHLPLSVVRYFKFTMLGPLLPALVLGVAYLVSRVRPEQVGVSPQELALLVQFVLALVPFFLFAYIVTLGLWYVRLVRAARDAVLRARLGRPG